MVSSVLQLDVTGNGTTIEFAVEALLLNKIWPTRIICKKVILEPVFTEKHAPAPTRSAESGIFCCYSQLHKNSPVIILLVFILGYH